MIQPERRLSVTSAISEARKAGYAEGHAAGKREAVLEARSALERATQLLDAAVASANRQIARAAGTVVFAIIFGQLAGLARSMLIARMFPAIEQDAFFAGETWHYGVN